MLHNAPSSKGILIYIMFYLHLDGMCHEVVRLAKRWVFFFFYLSIPTQPTPPTPNKSLNKLCCSCHISVKPRSKLFDRCQVLMYMECPELLSLPYSLVLVPVHPGLFQI